MADRRAQANQPTSLIRDAEGDIIPIQPKSQTLGEPIKNAAGEPIKANVPAGKQATRAQVLMAVMQPGSGYSAPPPPSPAAATDPQAGAQVRADLIKQYQSKLKAAPADAEFVAGMMMKKAGWNLPATPTTPAKAAPPPAVTPPPGQYVEGKSYKGSDGKMYRYTGGKMVPQ